MVRKFRLQYASSRTCGRSENSQNVKKCSQSIWKSHDKTINHELQFKSKENEIVILKFDAKAARIRIESCEAEVAKYKSITQR